jgi:geranylgeranyl pyrophosphate synthase
MPTDSAVETVYNFTLVHDDIVDNDKMRHGVPTTHKKFVMTISTDAKITSHFLWGQNIVTIR